MQHPQEARWCHEHEPVHPLRGARLLEQVAQAAGEALLALVVFVGVRLDGVARTAVALLRARQGAEMALRCAAVGIGVAGDFGQGAVRGAGEQAFCAGGDIKAMNDAAKGGESYVAPPSGYGGLTSRFDLNKPVIAAVNGLALGGGFEIALAADIVIAVEHARFGLPEPLIGPAALAGGLLAALATGAGMAGLLGGLLAVFGLAARGQIALIRHYRHLIRHEGEEFGAGLALRGARERLAPTLTTALAAGLALPLAHALGYRAAQGDAAAHDPAALLAVYLGLPVAFKLAAAALWALPRHRKEIAA